MAAARWSGDLTDDGLLNDVHGHLWGMDAAGGGKGGQERHARKMAREKKPRTLRCGGVFDNYRDLYSKARCFGNLFWIFTQGTGKKKGESGLFPGVHWPLAKHYEIQN